MQDQQDNRGLRVWERERQKRQLHAVLELHHAAAKRRECTSEQRRWDADDLLVDGIHDDILNPAEYQVQLELTLLERRQGPVVEALAVDDLQLVEAVEEAVLVALLVGPLQLHEGQGAHQADETREHVLEPRDIFGLCLRYVAEGEDAADRRPPRPHHLWQEAAASKVPIVGLRGPEDDQEAEKGGEGRVHRGLDREIVMDRLPAQDLVLFHVLHQPRQHSAG
mmetsp:Transcript_14350/g.34234  ORF Transcript_14350/g.34234 Transcript_14350/m.34234 type:complete len:223 (-) Transcript_14350:148-816(-)